MHHHKINQENEPIDTKTPLFQGFIRGMLPYYIMLLLKNTPLHGTEIIRSLSEMSGHSWKPSPGSVYPILRRLEQQGDLSGRWKRGQAAPQRIYKLTKKGKESLPGQKKLVLRQLRQMRELIDAHLTAFEQEGDLS